MTTDHDPGHTFDHCRIVPSLSIRSLVFASQSLSLQVFITVTLNVAVRRYLQFDVH
jgi:hypothetical protein